MRRLIAVVVVAGMASAAQVRDGKDGRAATQPATQPAGRGVDWSAFLIHDAAVQAELKLSDPQRKAVREAIEQVEEPLWSLRDLPPDEAARKSEALAGKLQERLKGALSETQRGRLGQIALQYGGAAALLNMEPTSRLALTEDQRQRIAAVAEKTRLAFEGIAGLSRNGQRQDVLDKLSQRVRIEERNEIRAALTNPQKQLLLTLVGKPFDLSRVKPMTFHAPEFRGEQVWINSQPLTLAGLRGKVVLVHFWTFGCSNCIHNYPSYRAWQTDYVPKGLVMVGIHTPETNGERKVESVRAKAKDNELNFPILVDNGKQNWSAWGNNIWPAVYLVDKQGRIRHWWYGELNWKGAEGQKYMGAKIAELLAE
jgi:peroxiredoxin